MMSPFTPQHQRANQLAMLMIWYMYVNEVGWLLCVDGTDAADDASGNAAITN